MDRSPINRTPRGHPIARSPAIAALLGRRLSRRPDDRVHSDVDANIDMGLASCTDARVGRGRAQSSRTARSFPSAVDTALLSVAIVVLVILPGPVAPTLVPVTQ